MGVKWKTCGELQREITDEEHAARILNRLSAFGLSEKEDSDSEVPELDAPRIKALEVVLDRIKPKLSSADITAHSSPQMEGEEALLARLADLLEKNPQLINDIRARRQAQALTLVPPVEHTQPEGDTELPVEGKPLTNQ